MNSCFGIVICSSIKDYNTVPFVGFQNDYVPVLSETPQDAVFFEICSGRSIRRYVAVSQVRKACNYFAGVGGVNKMSFHRVANQFEASKNISLANGRRINRDQPRSIGSSKVLSNTLDLSSDH